MKDTIVLAVFTGTGNSLTAARHLADRLTAEGKRVSVLPLENPDTLTALAADANATLGIIVPVACFTTYPTVWRFIDALPAGEGHGVFFLATMGGSGMGMQGPIGRALARKGYRLLAAATVRACGNYGAGAPAEADREAVVAALGRRVDAFADKLLAGRGGWGRGWLNPLSAVFAWLGRRGTPFRFFRRVVPIQVEAAVCTGCGLCAGRCPERVIVMQDGRAAIGEGCQSCQRCVGFCPVKAIHVPGKPPTQYRAVSEEEMRRFFDSV